MDQQRAYVTVAALADAEYSLLAAGAVLPRRQAQCHGHVATVFELAGIADHGDQCRGDQRADSPYLLHPTHGFILAAYRPDLLIELTHTFIECPQIRVQPGKQRSQTYRQSIGRIIMDSNPPEDDSWWYKLFEEQSDDSDTRSVEIFKQPSGRSAEAENLPNLSPNYYANLAAGMDTDFIRVYVDGLYGYVKDGKPVYPDYNDALHCAEVEPVKGVTIARGWDFGLEPACVFTQVLPDGRWIIFEELCGEDVGIHRFSDGVLELCERRWPGFSFDDWGDPAGEQRTSMSRDRDEKTCFDVLKGKGIRIRGGEQNITARLESVRKPLNTLRNGRPQLQLHPRCEMLRKGFRGRHQFRRVRIAGSAERYHDTPDKNEYSHPHDALQYVATAVFGGVVRGREEGRQGLKLEPLDKLHPEWAARMKKAMS